jgi:hypothetical protein
MGAALGRPPFKRAEAREGEIEMSKRVRYPNGFIGVASDKVAAILEKRPGYKIVGDAKAEEPKPAKEKEKDKEKDKE